MKLERSFADQFWVSGGGTLVAVPHCAIYPEATKADAPAPNRDAAQMSVINIPGLRAHFLYLEDDMIAVASFNQRDFWDHDCGQVKVYLNDPLDPCQDPEDVNDDWPLAKLHSVSLLARRCVCTYISYLRLLACPSYNHQLLMLGMQSRDMLHVRMYVCTYVFVSVCVL